MWSDFQIIWNLAIEETREASTVQYDFVSNLDRKSVTQLVSLFDVYLLELFHLMTKPPVLKWCFSD